MEGICRAIGNCYGYYEGIGVYWGVLGKREVRKEEGYVSLNKRGGGGSGRVHSASNLLK